jgi:hypothetical protein
MFRRRQQYSSIDICLRSDSRKVAQVFRQRSDCTMLAFAENGFVQISEGGDAVKFGPVMVHNFLLNFNVTDIDLRPFLDPVSDEDFQEIWDELKTIHGTDGAQFKRVDRLVCYTSMRYVIRDFCQIQQRTLRKRLTLQTPLK